jgi:hypothetical protein
MDPEDALRWIQGGLACHMAVMQQEIEAVRNPVQPLDTRNVSRESPSADFYKGGKFILPRGDSLHVTSDYLGIRHEMQKKESCIPYQPAQEPFPEVEYVLARNEPMPFSPLWPMTEMLPAEQTRFVKTWLRHAGWGSMLQDFPFHFSEVETSVSVVLASHLQGARFIEIVANGLLFAAMEKMKRMSPSTADICLLVGESTQRIELELYGSLLQLMAYQWYNLKFDVKTDRGKTKAQKCIQLTHDEAESPNVHVISHVRPSSYDMVVRSWVPHVRGARAYLKKLVKEIPLVKEKETL